MLLHLYISAQKMQNLQKAQNCDNNSDFDQLGVEIGLWLIYPKRCARSTYGMAGDWVVEDSRKPQLFSIKYYVFVYFFAKKSVQKFTQTQKHQRNLQSIACFLKILVSLNVLE